MKTIYLIIAANMLVCGVYASSNDTITNHSTKKNEIGLILNPVGIVLLGGQLNGQRLGISYKKEMKTPRLYFTSGIYYQRYRNDFNKGNELTLEVNGLLRNIQYRNEVKDQAMLSLGAEKRWTVILQEYFAQKETDKFYEDLYLARAVFGKKAAEELINNAEDALKKFEVQIK